MYLSRVELDKNNRQKIKDLTHVGAYHSWVEDSFPEEEARHERTRKLWRLDTLGGHTYLLVVSEEKPDLVRLEKYGVPGSAQAKNYDRFLAGITAGKRYRFRAVLNPAYSVSAGSASARGRTYPEVTADQQLTYFAKKAEPNGFILEPGQYTVTERRYVVLKESKMKPVYLCQAAFEGVLQVNDADLFRRALTQGIGRKKAYGFGMMTVIPVE